MTGEFSRQISSLGLDEAIRKKVLAVIMEAGDEFPCLQCASKDTCENFKWYIKWFT